MMAAFSPDAPIPWQAALWATLLALVLAAGARWLRARRVSPLPPAYARALRLLARRGLPRSALPRSSYVPSQTAAASW